MATGNTTLMFILTQHGKVCGNRYHAFSGLTQLLNDYIPNATYEGENVVMALQAARYLVKAALDGFKGKEPVGNAKYLGNLGRLAGERWNVKEPKDVLDFDNLVAAFAHRSARLIGTCAEQIGVLMEVLPPFVNVFVHTFLSSQKGEDFKTAFDKNSVDLVIASKAHCAYILVLNFVDTVKSLPNTVSFKPVISQLCALFALYELEKAMGDFIEDGFVSARQASFVRSQSRALLALIRPNAVALVDSFNFSDYSLNSSLGRHDGDVYRDMYKRAQLEPLNATPEGPAWDIIKTVVPKGLNASKL